MRLRFGVAFFCACAAAAMAGCGSGQVIGSTPLPTATPFSPKVVAEFTAPPGSNPGGIVQAASGYMYYAEPGAASIGTLTAGGTSGSQYLAGLGTAPSLEAIGPDGNVWFTDPAKDAVGIFGNGGIREYPVGAAPGAISKGTGENELYFTEPAANAIGSISIEGTASPAVAIPTAGAQPLSITLGPGLAESFTEYAAAKIGVLNQNGSITEYPLPAGSLDPDGIVQGPSGNVWFTEDNPAGPKLGTMSANGSIAEFALTGAKSATALTFGADNNVYFLDPANNAIGQFIISTQTTNEFPIITANALATNPATPEGITVGPDQEIYFTESNANQIGEFRYF